MKYRVKHLWLVGRARLRDRRSQSRNKFVTQFSARSPLFRPLRREGGKKNGTLLPRLLSSPVIGRCSYSDCYLHLELVISSRYRIDAVIALIVLAQLVHCRCNSLELTAAASMASLGICFRTNARRSKLYFIVYSSYFARGTKINRASGRLLKYALYVFITFRLKK